MEQVFVKCGVRSGFVYKLSADVLGCEPEKERPVSMTFDLTADVFLIIGELAAELFRDLYDSICIINNVYLSENDHAFYVQRPLAIITVSLVVYAKGYFVVKQQRIVTVTALPAVEIYNTVVIQMIHGHSVGISHVTDDGEYTSLFLSENADAFIRGKLALCSGKSSEHYSASQNRLSISSSEKGSPVYLMCLQYLGNSL